MKTLRAIQWVFLSLIVAGSAPALALESQPFIKESFLTLKDDLDDAAKAGRILMVMYEQEGCPYCALMHRVNFADKGIVDRVNKSFHVVQLDIWGGREVTDFAGEAMTEKQLARRMGIQFSPMISFFDANGKEVYRITGYYKPNLFKAALDYVASRAYEKMGFKDYAAKHAARPTPKRLIDEPFFAQGNDLQAIAQQARAQGKGLALLFEQAQCDDCAELHDRNFMDADTLKLLTDHFAVARIDLWGKKVLTDLSGAKTTEADLAQALNIRYTPAMVFYDKDGQELLRHESYLKPEHFATLLIYLTTDARLKYGSFQDWLRFRNAPPEGAQ